MITTRRGARGQISVAMMMMMMMMMMTASHLFFFLLEFDNQPAIQNGGCSKSNDSRSLPNNQTLLSLVAASFSSLQLPFLPLTVPPSSMYGLVVGLFSLAAASG